MIFEKQIIRAYQGSMLHRCDDTGNVYYFTAGDFPGLMQEAFAFPSAMGHTLRGWFYHYPDPIPGRLVVFDHGFGGGHTAYMKEIELLCRHGYLVFSYDHTGCMASGGADPNALTQSLADLDDCITALKAHPRSAGLDISVMGHSWGGFSTMNICALHPDISHVVAISGFVAVEQVLKANFPGILKAYIPSILRVERQNNPKYADYNAAESLRGTTARVLLIYSDDDKMVRREQSYDVLREKLAGKENIRLLLVQGKGHNPNYTADAVGYKDGFFADLTRRTRKKLLETREQKAAFIAAYDWNRMTAQDETVWAEVFRTLDG